MRIVILVLTFIGLIACTASDPKEAYISYIKKADQQSGYKIVYEYQVGPLESTVDSDMKIGIFKLDDKEMVVSEISTDYQKISDYRYSIDGRDIYCRGYAEGISCDIKNSEMTDFISILDVFDLTEEL